MELVILKITNWQESKQGHRYKYVFMKDEATGQSYKTCIYEAMRNYQRWQPMLQVGNLLAGLRIKKGNLIDADSQVWLKGKVELKSEKDIDNNVNNG